MKILDFFVKQGPTRHRPMAHPVVFRYLSYSTTLAEHAWPSAKMEHVCSRLFNEMMSDLPAGWPHDHGPTNVGAMVKREMCPGWNTDGADKLSLL